MILQAVIVSIGDELTLGQTVDTNAAWLSAAVARMGVEVREHITLGDDQADILAHLRRVGVYDVVIATGGLGPTDDDLTRYALAATLDVDLVLNEPALARMEAFFARLGRPMIARNRVQAMIPAGCEVIDNPVGTACGIAARLGPSHIFCLPGVPSEMRAICEQSIFPRIRQLAAANGGGEVIVSRTLRCYGAGESNVADMLGDMMTRGRNPVVNSTVAMSIISIRINARAANEAAAAELIAPVEAEVRKRLGSLVYGAEDETLADVVVQRLRARGETVATAESCTGGLIGMVITNVAGASDCYRGGWVCYSNEAKTDMLGVDAAAIAEHGAVSEPVAAQLAAHARERLGATYALSATGIAGPTGDTPDKPVGLVFIGLAGPRGVEVRREIFNGDRAAVRLRTANTALNMLRMALIQPCACPDGTNP